MTVYKEQFSASIQQAIYLEKNLQLHPEKKIVIQPGAKGKVANIDLFTCAEFIFTSDNFEVDIVENRVHDAKTIAGRKESFVIQLKDAFGQNKRHSFFTLLDHRIDCLYMKASFDDSRKRHFLSFYDSIQCFLTSLNNLEEHLHAFTNAYIVLSREKFSNLPAFIIGPLLGVGAIMVPNIMRILSIFSDKNAYSVKFCILLLLLNGFLLIFNTLDFEDKQLFVASNVALVISAATSRVMQEAAEYSAAFYMLALTFRNAFFAYASAAVLVPILVLFRFLRKDQPQKICEKAKNE